MKRLILNEISYFGFNARKALIDEVKKNNFKKALIITDQVIKKVGILDLVLEVLGDFNYDIYDEVIPNPTVLNVKEGLRVLKEKKSDFIIALGGGSVIDCAKAIAIISENPEFSDVVSLEGLANTKNRCLPIIAMPTTAGTAAEVTINYVITDTEKDVKMVCVDPNDLPIVSIVDTDFLKTMPKNVTASTGMDALTHAIEGYITKGANEFSDMFHLTAIKMIYNNLESAVNGNLDALDQMGMAQYIAGMGFSNVGLGIVHSMAHPLGALYDTPHGVANALLLPYVMEFNGEGLEEKYKEIGKCFNLNMDIDKSEIVKTVVDEVKKLSIKLDIPQTLSSINVKESDFDILSEKAFADPCTPGNPKDVSVSIIKELYKKAF